MDHAEAVAQLGQSHVALCLLDDLPGAARIYPAKIFEIMYLGRPCLALAPEGALSRLVREYGLGAVIHPRDAEAICAALASKLRSFRAGTLATHTSKAPVERFDRRRQAGEFARIFRVAVEHARSTARQSGGHGTRALAT